MLHAAGHPLRRGVIQGRDFRLFRRDIAGEDAFQLVFVELGEFRQLHALAAGGKDGFLREHAQQRTLAHLFRHFQHESAAEMAEQQVKADIVFESEAQTVAQAHLERGGGDAVAIRRPGGADEAGRVQFLHPAEEPVQAFRFGQAVCTIIRGKQDDLIAGALEFGGDDLIDGGSGHGKGDEGGRHVQLFEAAAHGVLAADGA